MPIASQFIMLFSLKIKKILIVKFFGCDVKISHSDVVEHNYYIKNKIVHLKNLVKSMVLAYNYSLFICCVFIKCEKLKNNHFNEVSFW